MLLFTLKDYGKFVDNKKKIQMLFVKYVFYFTREVDNNYISFVASPLMKYIVHFTREIKDLFNKNI